MDFSKIYKKLPKRIRQSDSLTYYAVNFSTHFHNFFKSKKEEKDPFFKFFIQINKFKS